MQRPLMERTEKERIDEYSLQSDKMNVHRNRDRKVLAKFGLER